MTLHDRLHNSSRHLAEEHICIPQLHARQTNSISLTLPCSTPQAAMYACVTMQTYVSASLALLCSRELMHVQAINLP